MVDPRRRSGWIGMLLALTLLLAVGFLGGAFAGFLWEEPRLVLAYLTGRTEPVEWSDAGSRESVAAAPDALPSVELPSVSEAAPDPAPESVAKAPPEPEAESAPAPTAPAPKVVAKPAPEPALPAVAAAPGRFSVQVGAFGESGPAEQLAKRLRSRGYESYVVPATASGPATWRVRVGRVAARAQAEKLAAKLAKGEKLPTWVIDEGEG